MKLMQDCKVLEQKDKTKGKTKSVLKTFSLFVFGCGYLSVYIKAVVYPTFLSLQ